MIKIVLNADDFGMKKNLDDKILNFYKNGLLSSTTVLIQRASKDSLKKLKVSGLPAGLHLETDIKKSAEANMSLWQNQLDIFQRTLFFPTHLDAHRKEIYLKLSYYKAFLHFSQKNGLATRTPFTKNFPECLNCYIRATGITRTRLIELYKTAIELPNKVKKPDLFFLNPKSLLNYGLDKITYTHPRTTSFVEVCVHIQFTKDINILANLIKKIASHNNICLASFFDIH